MSTRNLESPDYSVDFDPFNRMIRVTLRGYWSLEVANRYNHDFRNNLHVMPDGGCPLGDQLTYLDVRDFPVQSQEVLGVLGQMSNDPVLAAKRTAVITSSALLGMQARRVAPNYHLFSDPQAAMHWLETGIDCEASLSSAAAHAH